MKQIVKRVLFDLLRRAVWDIPIGDEVKQYLKEDTKQDTPTLMPMVYDLAKKHDLAHLVSVGLSREGLLSLWQNAPEGTQGRTLYDKLYRQESLAVYRFECQHHTLDVLCQALTEQGIDHLPLKGVVLCEKYPKPWMRTGCDIDLLVRPCDIDKACACLTNTLKCQPRKGDIHSHDRGFLTDNGVAIELHFALQDPLWKTYDILDDVWTYAKEDIANPYAFVMPPEIFYFYHLTHMAKHIAGGGCGIRPFLDLFLMGKMPPACQNWCEMYGLTTFAGCAYHLAEVWFGEGEHTPLSQDLEAYVLEGGVYGNLDNRVQVQPQISFWRKVFLPYEQLKYRYPVLQKHKWLTPLFEVVRWFAVLLGGGISRNSKEHTARQNANAKGMSHLLQDLGLEGK